MENSCYNYNVFYYDQIQIQIIYFPISYYAQLNSIDIIKENTARQKIKINKKTKRHLYKKVHIREHEYTKKPRQPPLPPQLEA
jgi:hypothetical protein